MGTEPQQFAERYGIVGAAGIVALYLIPLMVFGKDTIFPVLDVLDSFGPLFKVLVESGKIFASSSELIPAALNGLPRGCFGSEFNVLVWMFYFLDDYAAHVLNEVIIHFTALFGMFVLLKAHVVKDKEFKLIAVAVSLLFALLTFFPYFGLAIAGMPLLLYAFLNVRNKHDRWYDWAIICGLPFYSFFPSVGVFLVVSLGLLLTYDRLIKKRSSLRFASAILLYSAVSLLIEYRLLSDMIIGTSGFVSHRLERTYQLGASLSAVWASALDMFWNGQYHAVSSHTLLLPVILLGLVLSFRLRGSQYSKVLALTLASLTLIALGSGFWSWGGLDALKQRVPIMRTFQFNRFYMLNPLLWYVSLASALCIISLSLPRLGKYISIVTTLVVVGSLFGQNLAFIPLKQEVRALLPNREERTYLSTPSYKQFFGASLFQRIDQYIGRPKNEFTVVSIGLHPSVAQYNRFHTLDGYFGNYPLAYKHQFRRIIEGELLKSEKWRRYFDTWGNRAYIFVKELENSEHPFMEAKDDDITVENLSLNPDALRALNCKYVISAVRIENATENSLLLENVFEDSESFWRIHLYRLAQL